MKSIITAIFIVCLINNSKAQYNEQNSTFEIQDIDNSESSATKSKVLKFTSVLYIYSYSSALDHDNSEATTHGVQFDFYRARARKLGFGISTTIALSLLDLGRYDFIYSTMALSVGPGLFVYTSDRFNLWLGAYVCAAYNRQATYYKDDFDFTDDPNEGDLEDITDYSFFPDISAQASFRLLGRLGIVAKAGWSDIYMTSIGLSIGPKRK